MVGAGQRPRQEFVHLHAAIHTPTFHAIRFGACGLVQLFKGRWTYHPDDNTGLITIGGSRALIEESIRVRLLALWPNVHILCNCRAIAPIWSSDFVRMEGTLLPKQGIA